MDFPYLFPIRFHPYRHQDYYSTGVVYYVSDLTSTFYGNMFLQICLTLTVSVFLFILRSIPEDTI
nr:MAG TPA: hypothetical protein [Caudoviricetes sp.]DAU90938.1 MAG TPA: hypothetical protein [Caudoviricetes sp.]